MSWCLAVIFSLLPLMVLADGMPKAVAVQVERDADRYLDELSVLIDGYGAGGAIDRDGLNALVAMARADARAVAFRRLQGADLDGDGAIAGLEMRATAAAQAATARGRMILNFGKADLDGDDQVTAIELQAYANAAALKAFSDDKAAAVYAIMGFDGDGDGRVTVAEAKRVISALASSQGPGREIQNKLQIQGDNHHGDQNRHGDKPAWRDQGPHLRAIGGEHHQGNDREAEL